MKTERERMDIVATYEQVGTYRATAALCATTHKTVKRVIEAARAGETPGRKRRPARPPVTEVVTDLVAQRVRATDGRITAKRLLGEVRAAGYTGSSGSFRRVASVERPRVGRLAETGDSWAPYHLLRLARPVDVGRVDEVDAGLERCVDDGGRLVPGRAPHGTRFIVPSASAARAPRHPLVPWRRGPQTVISAGRCGGRRPAQCRASDGR